MGKARCREVKKERMQVLRLIWAGSVGVQAYLGEASDGIVLGTRGLPKDHFGGRQDGDPLMLTRHRVLQQFTCWNMEKLGGRNATRDQQAQASAQARHQLGKLVAEAARNGKYESPHPQNPAALLPDPNVFPRLPSADPVPDAKRARVEQPQHPPVRQQELPVWAENHPLEALLRDKRVQCRDCRWTGLGNWILREHSTATVSNIGGEIVPKVPCPRCGEATWCDVTA
eukprot:TRINITY_DN37674_c0_g2_i2.p1 TRINITY_DN37674_c0_g2~~TRINITY_DN37674_c0_g2_i2.p1  ORF type:complete len:228 (+),score=41.80 TRINITY_DN37674_c0_g2_i2:68-751(+)